MKQKKLQNFLNFLYEKIEFLKKYLIFAGWKTG